MRAVVPLLLIALLVAGWIMTVTLGPQPVLVAEPSLPPDLLRQGYSPEVVVRRVLDDVTRLREAADHGLLGFQRLDGGLNARPSLSQD